MRKLDGTTPLASPECTPSLRISTFSVPVMLPRRLVVSQELVVVAGAAVEADDEADAAEPLLQRIDVQRQIGEPLSSQVSIRPTQRGLAMPCRSSAWIAVTAA